MKNKLTSLVAGVTCLAAVATQAQISVGPGGAGPLTFTTTPLSSEFSTFVLTGGAGTFVDAAGVDAAVAPLTVSAITAVSRQLPTSSTINPSAFSGGFRQNLNATSGLFIQSRPTTDGTNAANAMLGTFVNNSGMIRPSILLSYDLNRYDYLAGELPGFNVYYSLTGEAESWVPIVELTGDEAVGSKVGTLNLGSWAVGASLYVLWVDDNANSITDPSYTIDNMLISYGADAPTISQQPVGGEVLEGRDIRLTVAAQGIGLAYQWEKSGVGPINGATSASYTLTNAIFPDDSGDYFVTVYNVGGSVSSAPAHVDVIKDDFDPKFVSASIGGDAFTLIVAMDERLCDDSIACGTQVSDTFSWEVVNPNDPTDSPGVSATVLTNGTNVIITTGLPMTVGQVYRVLASDQSGGIGDIYGNVMEFGTFIDTLPTVTFQQNVNGYAGTQDTEPHSLASADSALGANPSINVDNDDNGVAQALVRFDDIIGPNLGQVPSGALIVSATLTLQQTDPGSIVNLHRMLVNWNQGTVTWNTLVDGVNADGIDAVIASDMATPLSAPNGPLAINVTTSVQAWANGAPNYGWAFLSTGTDGWRWSTSEGTVAPILSVVYKIVPCIAAPVIAAQPPATLAVNEGSPITISVSVDVCQPTFQWLKDGNEISGATSPVLGIAVAVPGAGGSAGSYRLRITNPNGTVLSDATVVSVNADTTRPVLTRAASTSSTTIVLSFNKALSAASAQNIANYSLSGGATVSAAVLANGANNATVTLTTSARGAAVSTLTITGVTDNRAGANAINPNPTTVTLTGSSIVPGTEWAGAWLFNTNNLDADAAWKDAGYTPGADWQTGNGLFGTEPSTGVIALFPTPIVTVIPPNSVEPADAVTAYFRKEITLPPLGAGLVYVLKHFIDDGAVFYLNGVEFGRFNMPAGPVSYSTRAATANEATQQSLRLPASASAGGNFTLAIEVHQGGATTSSDIMFAAEIAAITAPPALSIARNDTGLSLNWAADSNWRLLGANDVAGPYTAVAGNPFMTFAVPTASQTNHNFYLLEFNPAP